MSKTVGFIMVVAGFAMMFFRGPVQLAGVSLAVMGTALAYFAERTRI